MKASDIKPGDEVRIFPANLNWAHPEGGWVAEVTRAGRKYATATWMRESTTPFGPPEYAMSGEFDIETGYERRGDHHTGRRMRTLAQLADDDRRADAVAVLHSHHIEIGYRATLTTGQIEALAEVAKTFGQEG